MEIVIIILAFLILGAFVFFGILVKKSIDSFLQYHRQSSENELKKVTSKDILQIKLQSYERLTIFLDRINLDHLVLRNTKTNQTKEVSKNLMVKNIMEEFNHNIVQQLYVSEKAWNTVVWAKEKTIQIIEESYTESEENDSGIDFGRKILIKAADLPVSPASSAIYQLKKDVQVIF